MRYLFFVFAALLVAGSCFAQTYPTQDNPGTDTVNTRYDWRTYVLKERKKTCAYPPSLNETRFLPTIDNDVPKEIFGDNLKVLLQCDRGVIDTLDPTNTDNGLVKRWEDQSGNENHAYNFTEASMPQFPYYHPARHNGVFFHDGDYLSLTKPVQTNTMIVVFRYDSLSLFGAGADKTFLSVEGASPNFGMTAAGALTSSDGVDGYFTNYTINEMVTTDMDPYDSHKVVMGWAATWSGASTQTWRIGAHGLTPSVNFWSGHVFELMLIDAVPTAAQRDSIYGYLEDKYLLYPTCYDTLGYRATSAGYAVDSYMEAELYSIGMPDTFSLYKEEFIQNGNSWDTVLTKMRLIDLESDSSYTEIPIDRAETSSQGKTIYRATVGVYASQFERYFWGKSSGVKNEARLYWHEVIVKTVRRF